MPKIIRARQYRQTRIVRQRIARMAAIWATDPEKPGKGGGLRFPGFGKGE